MAFHAGHLRFLYIHEKRRRKTRAYHIINVWLIFNYIFNYNYLQRARRPRLAYKGVNVEGNEEAIQKMPSQNFIEIINPQA